MRFTARCSAGVIRMTRRRPQTRSPATAVAARNPGSAAGGGAPPAAGLPRRAPPGGGPRSAPRHRTPARSSRRRGRAARPSRASRRPSGRPLPRGRRAGSRRRRGAGGSVILVTGTAGTFKTSLTFHLFYHNVKAGSKALFITLEEGAESLREAMESLGMTGLDDMPLYTLDVATIRPEPQEGGTGE